MWYTYSTYLTGVYVPYTIHGVYYYPMQPTTYYQSMVEYK